MKPLAEWNRDELLARMKADMQNASKEADRHTKLSQEAASRWHLKVSQEHATKAGQWAATATGIALTLAAIFAPSEPTQSHREAIESLEEAKGDEPE